MLLNDSIFEYMKNDKIVAHLLQYRLGVFPLLWSSTLFLVLVKIIWKWDALVDSKEAFSVLTTVLILVCSLY